MEMQIDYTQYFVDIIEKIISNNEILIDIMTLLQLNIYLQLFISGVILAVGVVIVIKGLI